jgi:hypothetical protein
MDQKEAAQVIRDWMVATKAAKGWSARKWAIQASVGPSAVQKALKDDYEFVTSTKTLTALAKAAGVAPPDLTGLEMGPSPVTAPGGPVELPIRGEVGAGPWRKIDELPQGPIGYFAEAHRIPGFEAWPQWIERVVGDSYNQRIPDGALVHVVDAIAMGYAPSNGDTVVVERRSGQGAFIERSLKQVVQTPFALELWPRSHNPDWNQPIDYRAGARGEDIEVQVVGKVLRAYLNP